MQEYKSPEYQEGPFTCPNCGAFAGHKWEECYFCEEDYYEETSIAYATCCACDKKTIWLDKELIYPLTSQAPLPCNDMPENIKSVYLEARNIISLSPRGACALLRLALQLLLDELVEGQKNPNQKIAQLVKQGLPNQLQKAFDIVRLVGNNAVHPGEINIDDNPEIAQTLFKLINMIVEKMITEPKELENFYSSMPEKQLEAIAKRDA